MKKIMLVLALVLSVSVAGAWNGMAEEGVVILASRHLSSEAKGMLVRYLGETYADDVKYLHMLERENAAKHTAEIHYLHLDKELTPENVEKDDALVAIEQSLTVVRAHNAYDTDEVQSALRTIINLMCDIHHLSNVRIEGVPHSQYDFTFKAYEGDVGSRKKISEMKWSYLWNSYSNWHTGMSGDIWAEDIELCLGAKCKELSEGSLHDWVAQIGETAAKLYAEITPEYTMTRRERNELEELNYEMMARAGYRLAALLNEAVK